MIFLKSRKRPLQGWKIDMAAPAELRAANTTARAMAKAQGITKAELLRRYGGFSGFLKYFLKK